jgi:hypothetical protein
MMLIHRRTLFRAALQRVQVLGMNKNLAIVTGVSSMSRSSAIAALATSRIP